MSDILVTLLRVAKTKN